MENIILRSENSKEQKYFLKKSLLLIERYQDFDNRNPPQIRNPLLIPIFDELARTGQLEKIRISQLENLNHFLVGILSCDDIDKLIQFTLCCKALEPFDSVRLVLSPSIQNIFNRVRDWLVRKFF
jgi:hypothetical protein